MIAHLNKKDGLMLRKTVQSLSPPPHRVSSSHHPPANGVVYVPYHPPPPPPPPPHHMHPVHVPEEREHVSSPRHIPCRDRIEPRSPPPSTSPRKHSLSHKTVPPAHYHVPSHYYPVHQGYPRPMLAMKRESPCEDRISPKEER